MKRLLIAAVLVCAAVGCQRHIANPPDGNPDIGTSGTIERTLAEANNRFAFSLLSALESGADGSIMISPTSVAIALTMTYNGARRNTQAQMADVLAVRGISLDDLNAMHASLQRFLEDPSSDIMLAVANSLWGRIGTPFDPDFLARNREFYGAQVRELDFSDPTSVDTINNWADEQTRGKIPTILDDVDPEAVLYLINAIYFKGIWTYTFDDQLTSNEAFYHPSGMAQHPMMQQQTDFEYLERAGFQAVRLPYGESGRFGMYIFLPRPGLPLREFALGLTTDSWEGYLADFSTRPGLLKLPRFTLRCEKTLNETLQALGMTDAFDAFSSDLTGMFDQSGWNGYISEVRHKTFMEVSEEGTEAVAVTSIEIAPINEGPHWDFVMIVNRPFLCAIVDRESGLILFIGTVREFD